MMLAPHPRSTAADLARVLACWLAVIVFLLGIGAAQALGRGPLHRHVESLATTQHHYHDEAERHHHDAQNFSVLEVANAQDDAVDAGALAWRTHISTALRKPPRQG